jgi:cytochrome c-type biogenesis protein CcsB
MSAATLAGLADQLVYLAVLSYLLAAALFGWQLASRAAWPGGAGLLVTVAGLAANGGAALARGLAVGRVPWGNMYEYSVMIGLVTVAGFVVWALRRADVRPLGLFFLLPAVLAIGAGRIALYAEPGPLVPALQSGWIRIHVLAAIIGSSLLTISAVASALYLVAERRERADQARPPLVAGAARTADESEVREAITGYLVEEAEAAPEGEPAPATRRHRLWLPAARTLDDLAYRSAVVGFPVWTFAVIAGAIWAQSAWGRYWGWDPKETWSFIVWTIFAAYLHARATAGWRARGAAWIAVVGLGAIVFNFYVVNTVLVGLHSYSGL